ncbi:hypothetical protein [Polymorphospora rubra]|uniref:hypothetical protein n=1 Tax=Polymorphospora rubra TaxID=338584 RepID=UPI001BB31C00|nr:hypothetical protein [Polymorphospora rubra]
MNLFLKSILLERTDKRDPACTQAAKGLEVTALIAAATDRPSSWKNVRCNADPTQLSADIFENVVAVSGTQLRQRVPNTTGQPVGHGVDIHIRTVSVGYPRGCGAHCPRNPTVRQL